MQSYCCRRLPFRLQHARRPPKSTTSKARSSTPKWRSRRSAEASRIASELNGDNFYFRQRDRVLNLEDYHRSLESLAQEHTFNPETRRPWNAEDAIARWDMVQKEAADDRRNCSLIAHLPELEKKLDELQKQTAAPTKK